MSFRKELSEEEDRILNELDKKYAPQAHEEYSANHLEPTIESRGNDHFLVILETNAELKSILTLAVAEDLLTPSLIATLAGKAPNIAISELELLMAWTKVHPEYFQDGHDEARHEAGPSIDEARMMRPEIIDEAGHEARMQSGSIRLRMKKCGKPACRCHNGGAKHGPYLIFREYKQKAKWLGHIDSLKVKENCHKYGLDFENVLQIAKLKERSQTLNA